MDCVRLMLHRFSSLQASDANKDQYVLIRAETQEKADAMAAIVNELMTDKGKRDALRSSQMQQRDQRTFYVERATCCATYAGRLCQTRFQPSTVYV